MSFCLSLFNAIAQRDSSFIHKGLIRAGGTFAFGTMPENKITNAYLTGDLEYYADKKISIRGDVNYFLNSLTQNSILKVNDALYFGAFYHIPTHSHFDPLFGLQPGISYSQVQLINLYSLNIEVPQLDKGVIGPVASVVLGFNYFAEKWFHIQVNVRYTIGEHLTNANETNISELSFNFGLGFNN